jgi:menaquinone-9 beta-reductase
MSIFPERDITGSEIVSQVVVVGGGPAGAAAAHAVAAAGFDVLLVERSSRGRDKACGDMFAPSAIAALKILGVNCPSLRAARAAYPFDAIELHGGRGPLWQLNYADDPVWIIPRKIIDQTLRDCLPTAARVIYDMSVIAIHALERGGLEIDAVRSTKKGSRIRCEAVIIATGGHSRLTDRWGISGSPVMAASISAYVRDCQTEIPTFEFLNSCRPGYRWRFPTGDGNANVGICSLARMRGGVLRALGEELLKSYNLARPESWRGGVGPLWSGASERWHHAAGVISCGDAAGLVDPINGEGLTAALTSGLAAGEAVVGYLLHDRDIGALRDYSNRVRAIFGARYEQSQVRMTWKLLSGQSRSTA